MGSLPISINPCPIQESVIEIRFSSELPSEAVFGVIYGSVTEVFQGEKAVSLPITQVPEQIRNNDENLRYQPHYRIPKGNLSLNIGPRTLSVANSAPYLGWKQFSSVVFAVIESTEKTGLMNNVERIGLRYINQFSEEIFAMINAELRINGGEIKDERTEVRTEIRDAEVLKVVHIGNQVPVLTNGEASIGSFIDIDCIHELDVTASVFYTSYKELIGRAHTKEKETFFELLKPEFLKRFNPIYS